MLKKSVGFLKTSSRSETLWYCFKMVQVQLASKIDSRKAKITAVVSAYKYCQKRKSSCTRKMRKMHCLWLCNSAKHDW